MKKYLYILSLSVLILQVSACKKTKDSLIETTPEEELFVVSDYTDSVFTAGIEGPAVDKDGNLYAVSFGADGTVGIVNSNKQASLFVTLPNGSTGNGIRFDSEKNMFIADYTGHNILKVDMQTKNISVFAHDNTMNQPNDIAISANDILFASDPKWSNNTGNLWRIDKTGQMTLLEGNMGTTNGVEIGTSEIYFMSMKVYN
jgi:gluconolactonase